MIKRKLTLLIVLLFATSCTECQPPKSLPDGYAVARAVVQGAQLGLLGADGVFAFVTTFLDAEKVPAIRDKYARIRAAVVSGLASTHEGIAVAESQKAGFDLAKLMAPADAAWRELRQFLVDLQAAVKPPSSMRAISTFSGRPAPLAEDLPPTIIPAK